MRTTYYFLLLIGLFAPLVLPAQAPGVADESYIELSPAELESLVRRLARHQSTLITNRTYQVPYRGGEAAQFGSQTDSQLREQLQRMENLLVQLTERMAANQEQLRLRDVSPLPLENEVGNEELIRELQRQNRALNEMEARLLARTSGTAEVDGSVITALRVELDSLRSALTWERMARETTVLTGRDTIIQLVPAPTPSVKDNGLVDSLFQEIARLRGSMSRQRDTIILQPESPTPVIQPAVEEVRNWPPIYFDNGSDVIPAADQSIILAVAQGYRRSGESDVIIVGYTSPKGSPIFNKKLAARRAEQVSRALQEAGIPPAAIITTYGGIDYQATNPAAARRVEIQTRNRP